LPQRVSARRRTLRAKCSSAWPQSTSPPYRNSAPALNDRLVGAVDAVIDNTTSIVPQARAGSVRALGISTLTRWPLAPDFAPIADTVPALAFSSVAVRSGTPAEICDSIEAAVKAVCKDPVLIERMTPLLAEVVGSGAKEFGEFIAAERANGENCSPTSNSVSTTSLKPLFAGGYPCPHACIRKPSPAVARSPPPKANAPFRLSSVRGAEPKKYSQPGPIGPPTLRGAACHAKMAAGSAPRQSEPLTAAPRFVRHHRSIMGDWRFLLEARPSRSSTWLDLDRPFYLYLTIGKAICWHSGGTDTKCELAELKLTSPG
jgi:Tripartite tricarboxylate transporter family receptor